MSLDIKLFSQIAKGLAHQFGDHCEVVLHDLTQADLDTSIVLIENGHITNRKKGDGPSHVVLDALRGDPSKIEDRLGYLTKTTDGRILKSTTLFIRDDNNKIIGIFAINYDITELMMFDTAVRSLIS